MSKLLNDISEGQREGGDHIEEGSRSPHIREKYRNIAIGILAAATLSGCAVEIIPARGYENHGGYHRHRTEPEIIIIRRSPPPPPPREIIIIPVERHRGRGHRGRH